MSGRWIFPVMSVFNFSTRYRHLYYKRREEFTRVEITQSIRAIFGTAHILDGSQANSNEGESEISDTTRSTFEDAVSDDNTVNIFICPLCGQDFSHMGSFSDHNKREHNSKIVQLEMFSYEAGKAKCEDF